jgi:hypothetical protein
MEDFFMGHNMFLYRNKLGDSFTLEKLEFIKRKGRGDFGVNKG